MLWDSELFTISVILDAIIDEFIKSKVVNACREGDEARHPQCPFFSVAHYWQIIETERKASTWATTPTIQPN